MATVQRPEPAFVPTATNRFCNRKGHLVPCQCRTCTPSKFNSSSQSVERTASSMFACCTYFIPSQSRSTFSWINRCFMKPVWSVAHIVDRCGSKHLVRIRAAILKSARSTATGRYMYIAASSRSPFLNRRESDPCLCSSVRHPCLCAQLSCIASTGASSSPIRELLSGACGNTG